MKAVVSTADSTRKAPTAGLLDFVVHIPTLHH